MTARQMALDCRRRVEGNEVTSAPRSEKAPYGSGFHPPLKVPPHGVRIAFQAAILVLIGMLVLRSHGLKFDLTPWSQVIINRLVDIVYPRKGQIDATVVLFRETNLRDFGDTYPVPYARHAEVLEALASYEPRSVFVDFAFIDERPDDGRLIEAMRRLSGSVTGGVYLAAPFGEEALARVEGKFAGSGVQLVSAGIDRDTGVSGVLTYSNGVGGPPEDGRRSAGGWFMPSPAFAMAQHRTGLAPAEAQRMELIWPSGTSEANERWMKQCSRKPHTWADAVARLMDDPLEEKDECPYTTTVSVAHLLGSFDKDVDAAIRGRTVFYGAAFEGVGDRAASPVFHDLPGVYLHAMAYDNLVSFEGHYKRADRGRLWSRPTLADLWLLVVVVVVWVVEGNRREVGERKTPEKPRAWLPRVERALVLMAVIVGPIVVISVALGFKAALLWVGVPGYLLYRVIMDGDWLVLWATGLLVLAAIVSFFVLDVGPRNIVGYLALLEVARHLGDRLDEVTGTYLRLRGAPGYDHEWGKWSGYRGLLDRVIGLWVRGSVERRRHAETAGGRA